MRQNLKDARKKLGLSQREMAEKLSVCQQYYSFLETGSTKGSIRVWDALEDMTGIHQRTLRENL